MLCIAQTLSSETPAGNIQGFLFLHTTHTAELYNSILYILKDMLYTELFGMYTNNIYIQVWHFIVLLLRHSFPIVFCILHFLEKNYCVLSGFFWQNFHYIDKKKVVPYNFAVAGKFAHIYQQQNIFFSLYSCQNWNEPSLCVTGKTRQVSSYAVGYKKKNKYIYFNNHMCVLWRRTTYRGIIRETSNTFTAAASWWWWCRQIGSSIY
jgi:hypothetical protein